MLTAGIIPFPVSLKCF